MGCGRWADACALSPPRDKYPRRLGPDRVQLKQLLEETAAEEAVDEPIVDLPSARACLGRLFAAANAKQSTTISIPSFASLLQESAPVSS